MRGKVEEGGVSKIEDTEISKQIVEAIIISSDDNLCDNMIKLRTLGNLL
jgi:hypothetical protein